MFNPGEVITFRSDQAAGYKSKRKHHLCVCGYRGRYFFINSDPWEDSFKITNQELPGLPNAVSHVACNTLLQVSDNYLKRKQVKPVGTLPRQTIERLIDHIDNCDVLTEDEKEIAIDGLSGAF